MKLRYAILALGLNIAAGFIIQAAPAPGTPAAPIVAEPIPASLVRGTTATAAAPAPVALRKPVSFEQWLIGTKWLWADDETICLLPGGKAVGSTRAMSATSTSKSRLQTGSRACRFVTSHPLSSSLIRRHRPPPWPSTTIIVT